MYAIKINKELVKSIETRFSISESDTVKKAIRENRLYTNGDDYVELSNAEHFQSYKAAEYELDDEYEEVVILEPQTFSFDDQKQLFDGLTTLKNRVGGLVGYVQNDFSLMIQHDDVSSDQLKNSICELNEDYDHVIKELDKYRNKSIMLINSHINKLEK